MKITRQLPLAALAALAIATTSCADITAPAPAPATQPSNGLIGGLLGGLINTVEDVLGILGQPVSQSVHVLKRTTPLAEPITVTQSIGYYGGTIKVPEAGLTVIVPRGAVYYNTKITVTALAGDQVAYEFGPHGMTFYKPLQVKQSLEGTYAENSNPDYEAVYYGPTKDGGLLGDLLGVVLELLNVNQNTATNSLDFEVRHFSGYLVSSGRMAEDSDSSWGR